MEPPNNEKVPDENCNMPCEKDPSVMCGAGGHNSVYEFTYNGKGGGRPGPGQNGGQRMTEADMKAMMPEGAYPCDDDRCKEGDECTNFSPELPPLPEGIPADMREKAME